MRQLCLVPLLLAGLTACATTETAIVDRKGQVEVGYAPGSLGYAAIMRNDLKGAETLLNAADAAEPDDPARLLNMAYVYRKTGREADALRLYQKVAAMPQRMEVQLANGKVASSQELALQALGLDGSYASLK